MAHDWNAHLIREPAGNLFAVDESHQTLPS
jgi:hypothetical protein